MRFDRRGMQGLAAYTLAKKRATDTDESERGFFIGCVDAYMGKVGQEKFISTAMLKPAQVKPNVTAFCVLTPRSFCALIHFTDHTCELLVYRF
jgi:hypothetical protein